MSFPRISTIQPRTLISIFFSYSETEYTDYDESNYNDNSENKDHSYTYWNPNVDNNLEKKRIKINGHEFSFNDDIYDYDQKANIDRQGILTPLLSPQVTLIQ